MNRKRVTLIVLIGLLAVCIVYAYLATPRLAKAPARETSRRAQSAVKAADRSILQDNQGRINFAFLAGEFEDFPGAQRDIFQYARRQAVRRKAPVRVETMPEVVPVVNAATMPVDLVVPIDVIQQSLGQFTFLGFLEKAGQKTVFLTSGGSLFVAKTGEYFGTEQEFKVVGIEKNLLQVRHAGRDGLIEVPLIEQQKLSAAVSAPAALQPDEPSVQQQSRTRIFTPQRKVLRPKAPQEDEEPLPELVEEYDPEVEQDNAEPEEGDVLEGEIDGTNQ